MYTGYSYFDNGNLKIKEVGKVDDHILFESYYEMEPKGKGQKII